MIVAYLLASLIVVWLVAYVFRRPSMNRTAIV